MRIIALVNQKGGCGKTTTAINLAAVAARQSQRTLLVDMDPQGHCAAGLGIPEERIEGGTTAVLLGEHMTHVVDQLKVLKVIDSAPAREEIRRVVDYFKRLEAGLAPAPELRPLLMAGGLKQRAAYLRKSLARRLRSLEQMESFASARRLPSKPP